MKKCCLFNLYMYELFYLFVYLCIYLGIVNNICIEQERN